jgi:hypothetical protein
MRFRANHVSTTVAGDYYQALFEERDESSDPDGPYLLIQRQFEMPDDDECYIETHNEEYIGHFYLRRADFGPNGISIEIDRPNNQRIDVTLAMTPDEYEAALPIIKMITE